MNKREGFKGNLGTPFNNMNRRRNLKVSGGSLIPFILFLTIVINRVLLNENYSGVFNDGYFYLFFCKHFEQRLFAKHMAHILENINNETSVLDFGSGPGIMSPFFNNYIGIDTDKTRISTALTYFPNKTFEHVDYITETNQNLPFQNNTFDIVLFNDCIHHISNKDMIPILNDINRILKPDGQIIVREPRKDTNLFTYFINEVFENGDYTRYNAEYKEIFMNYDTIYEARSFELVRDYSIMVFQNKKDKTCANNPDVLNIERTIIKYWTFAIAIYLLYHILS
jgi:ubiquinone/menaquinone biosynthesis C-methylase UbiE